ncbi:hypothetical protein KIW84_075274 [Lathyrus oleraceus]|uniref:Uncharacterized protein n=1 Tax=Pisum sativum TaxID=3888 RepID=A0A9D4VWA6_PEA|nr:hypothetical protein KIW84_075274 [Pisum sativum]
MVITAENSESSGYNLQQNHNHSGQTAQHRILNYDDSGGYELLGHTKDQIKTSEQINAALTAYNSFKLDGLVVGAHVTLSGDLKNQFEETNVGFDTSCKARAEQDKYHGVILFLEGLVESIPEIYALLKEIHVLLQQGVAADKIFVHLSPWASTLVEFLPPFIRRQLLLYTEPDDSSQSSQI